MFPARFTEEKGMIIFYEKLVKIKECQAISVFAIECLPKVVVDKNKPFHCNRLSPVLSVVKTKVESGQTQARMH